jgi:predicted flap endonuclease-1-like 5' DNA nuclease
MFATGEKIMPQYSNLSGEETNDDPSHPHISLSQSPTSKQSHTSNSNGPWRLVQFLPAVAALLTMGFIPAAGEPVGGLPWWAWLLIVIVLLLVIVLLWWLINGREAKSSDAAESAHTVQPVQAAPAEERLASPVEVAAISPVEAPVAAVVPDALPAAEATQPPAMPDDLEIIEGIGPKIASVFKAAGILTFQQLSQADPAQLQAILREAGLRLADPTTWPEQARLAAAGQWDELKALQDRLKGGR